MDKLVKVTVIFRKNLALLVEFLDTRNEINRVSIPDHYIFRWISDTEAFVEEGLLKTGIPYGLPFEFKLPGVTVTSHEIEVALHNVGIWTAEDVLKNTKSVQGALLSLIRLTVSDVMSLATKEIANKENV